jgi:hypothetical protein
MTRLITAVELMRLYSNLQDQEARLRELETAAHPSVQPKLSIARDSTNTVSARGKSPKSSPAMPNVSPSSSWRCGSQFTEPPLRHSSAAMTSHRQAVDDAVELVPRHIENDWLV